MSVATGLVSLCQRALQWHPFPQFIPETLEKWQTPSNPEGAISLAMWLKIPF